MKKVLLVVVLAACGGSRQPPVEDQTISNAAPTPPPDAAPDAAIDPPTQEDLINRLAAFGDEICHCTDKPCVDRVTEAMTTWSQEMSTRPTQDHPRMSEAHARRATEITNRMAKCMTAVMTGTSP